MRALDRHRGGSMNRIRLTLLLLGLVAAPLAAHGQTLPLCSAAGPNPVYILAADTQVNVLKAMGAQLATQAHPITVVYTPNGSCNNIGFLYNNVFTSNAAGGGTFYVKSDGTAANCDPTGITPDMAISIVFPDNTDCPTAPAKPANIGITQGPVQAFVFAVPGGVSAATGSTQRTITAEEAYLVFGIGAMQAMVAPWLDPQYLYGRTATKGTQVSIGANIGVAAAKWKLIQDPQHTIDQSTAVATSIANQTTSGNAEKTLGILGVEIYDSGTNRSQLHALSYRHYGQYHSYWPDSAPTSFDKRNVRDGHYPLWSYVQYLAPQSSTPGAGAAKPEAQTLIDLFSGKVPSGITGIDPLVTMVNNYLVPACAMKVSRSSEGGPLSPATPADSCSCFFEKTVPMGTTSCATCDGNTMCPNGTSCHHGYCEAP
jgi:hypothetical protein